MREDLEEKKKVQVGNTKLGKYITIILSSENKMEN